jgi:menaquinol-cytochrome c reductase iron-sulfur subunit
MPRRNFLTAAINSLLALTAAGLGIPALRYLLYPPKAARPQAWVDAGDLSEMEPDTPREVTFRRNRVDGWKVFSEKAGAWVIKRSTGGVTAFSPLCTHLGCAYRWEESRREFMCPCHGSWFDLEGRVIAGPAPRPLDRYEVRMEGDRLWLGPLDGGKAES